MSEVYIRSQNKEKLYRLGGNYACVEYGEYEDIKKKRVQNAIFKSFYRGTAGDNSDPENENDGEETTEEGNRVAVQEN